MVHSAFVKTSEGGANVRAVTYHALIGVGLLPNASRSHSEILCTVVQ
jgi:hypothetical protein